MRDEDRNEKKRREGKGRNIRNEDMMEQMSGKRRERKRK